MAPADDTGEPPADDTFERVRITAAALRDGSLIAAARLLASADPALVFLSDAEIETGLDAMLAGYPPQEDVWLFGYGSLMWNPAMHYAESRPGVVRGWHRSYCLWAHMGRGTPEAPGLMLALDRGGSSAGMLFRFPAATARAEVLLPWRREMFTGSYAARWVRVDTEAGPVRAVSFVANRAHLRYAGRLDEATIAAHLAVARGSLGTCVEYLEQTLAVLRAHGRTDHRLERLERLIMGRCNSDFGGVV
jgi:cation transport protein ChaC